MRRALALVALLLAPGVAHAQPATGVVAVDLNKATLSWDWAGSPDADTFFRVTCTTPDGSAPATITTVPSLAAAGAQTATPVIAAVAKQLGTFTCSVTAANTFGESPPSNAVTFRTGTAPPSATNVRVQGGQ